MKDKALVRQRRDKELVAILEKVAIDDAEVCQAATRALELAPGVLELMRTWEDDQLREAGWTRRDFEAAWEARKPMSECSYAVRLAHERTGMRIRQAVERGTTVTIANIVLPPQQQMSDEQRKRAPVIDVSPETK